MRRSLVVVAALVFIVAAAATFSRNPNRLALSAGETSSVSCSGPALSYTVTASASGRLTCSRPTTTTTVPASTTTTVPASTTTSVPASTTTTQAPPPPSGFPDATNTGYRNAPGYPGTLTPFTGTIQSNTTYNFVDFNGGAAVGLPSAHVSNVTFNGCRFHGTAVDQALVLLFGDNITFNYSSFEPGVAAPPVPHASSYQYGIEADGAYNSTVGKLTVSHSDLWGFGNAIDVAGSTQGKPQVFNDNWIHDSANDGNADYHTDGIGTESGSGTGSYVTINHNTIEAAGNTNGLAFQQGSYSHFTVTNNLFGGFGYTVAIWANTSTTFTGNTFSTRLGVVFGPLYPQTFWTGGTSLWRNNRWSVPAGAAWGSSAHDGWFWMPNPSDSPASDTPFVSQTDYAG